MVISFFLNKLKHLEKTVDWDKLKTEMNIHIAAIVPGEWLDPTAIKLADLAFYYLKKFLSNEAVLKQLIELLIDKKFPDALELVKKLFEKEIENQLQAVEGQFESHDQLLALVQELDSTYIEA